MLVVPTAPMFPNNLRVLRSHKGLTQRACAEAINLPRSRLYLYETGRELPRWQTAQLLMEYYGVTLAEIYPWQLHQDLIAQTQ